MDHIVKGLEEKLIQWRRQFHQFPEEGFMEFRTTERIKQELANLSCTVYFGDDAMNPNVRKGVPSQDELSKALQLAFIQDQELLGKMQGGLTGAVAIFDTGRKGPHTLLRVDIDALPIEEGILHHYPYEQNFASVNKGVMHACGHDGHVAIGLGVAHAIDKMLINLKGKITIIFQPAEEGGRGAKAFVDKGWLDDVDYFLSGHIGIDESPVGTVALTTTQFLSTTKMDAVFKGESVHAGKTPEEGRNALLSAAAAAVHLNGITRHSAGTTRINVGTLKAGTGRNIVADRAEMKLETRGATSELNKYMEEEAIRILQASALLFNTSVDIQITGTAESANCDEEWIAWGKEALANSAYVKTIQDTAVLGASEDATAYINAMKRKGAKSTYLIFSSPLKAPHHHPLFDFNEEVLPIAVSTFMHFIGYHHNTNIK